MAKPVRARIGKREIRCLTCGGDVFREREVKLNSTGMEFFNLAWANESATGLICWSCGYVQLFVNGGISLYRADA
ncbi:hypothetical protein ACFFSH_36720 [Streptomyces filamentosus]|uniref:DNA-binding protein n=1 Tax=Streptomyces filamentosus TaxID=67294 RepID=A0A919BBZ1_STRFL|nr:hypothetical protein [Streptomyces filamentosus]KAA6211230.1 hypothetical protein CP979_32860 [Streptomyces filamentosus]GHF78252.1 hypothetical protein GCM10017667_02020 [Streptomyces filamentosus]